MAKDTKVELVDMILQVREKTIDMLKFNLTKAQDRMKVQADKQRYESEFLVGLLVAEPVKLLNRKIVKQQNRMGVFGLIQWSNGNDEDVTWEDFADLTKRFHAFVLDL
ncbi:hypothetical protein Tco_0679102 [Tanacetum coccineum]|uniref:Chromo domain-containing protein n=1 Tax=Tanacetum coccineum TaxID=301880 RepID=A0ABQ4XHV6_9ASTR